MGFIDIFIKPEEEVNQGTAAAPVTTGSANMATDNISTQNVTNFVAPTNTGASTSTATNTEIVRNIWNVLISKNLPGPDFLEVTNNAAALESMGLPEDKRFEAAFKMLQTSYPNFTKDVLLSSIDTYIGFVDNEEAEGKKQCNKKREDNVGNKQLRIEQLTTHSDDLQKQIDELIAEKQKVITSIATLKDEVAKAVTSINEEEQIFINSVNEVRESLKARKTMISSLNI